MVEVDVEAGLDGKVVVWGGEVAVEVVDVGRIRWWILRCR